MTRRRLALAIVLVVLGALGWWRYGTRIAPAGQPPLVTIDALAEDALRNDFNGASKEFRIIVLLAPT